ncbi:MAG: hypothetical protein QW797_08815 [Thermoproteota archaeon]|nr:hypothetical protein [Candidatus Brockarchaeota archaeon]
MAENLTLLGAGLTVFGALLTLGSHLLLENTPLTALGIGTVILGLTFILTPAHPVPRETVQAFVKSSCENVEAILEATGAFMKAFYLPSSERVYAYVPLSPGQSITFEEIAGTAGSLLVRRGGDLGILIVPPGSVLVNSLAQEGAGGLSSSVEAILTEASEAAESVKTVEANSMIIVEINRPRLDVEYSRFRTVLGSLPSSMAAQAAAAALMKPVQIFSEENQGKRILLYLRVLEWTDTPSTSQR